MKRPRITGLSLVITGVVIVVGALIWASDKITLKGHHTIHTVQCLDGNWQGTRCTGIMVAGDRYRFSASRNRQEVIFWTAGSNQPSAKYTDCTVKDRDNWKCNVNPDQPATITHALVDGRPVDGGTSPLPIHVVHKWKWWLLRSGIHIFSTADY
jgi:hypothetical protein